MAEKSPSEQSVWKTLSAIDVSSFTEKKNGLTYLSWAHSWGVLKQHYPDATFEKLMFENAVSFGENHPPIIARLPYIADKNGYAYVSVRVSAGGATATEVFPVLNHANKPVAWPTSFDVNTALQRCLAKSIAYLGLGHYVYAGEDLPIDFANSDTGATINTTDKQAHVADTVDQIEAVFMNFIPLHETADSLREFYKINAQALTILSERAPDRYSKVVGEFTKFTKKLEAASGTAGGMG